MENLLPWIKICVKNLSPYKVELLQQYKRHRSHQIHNNKHKLLIRKIGCCINSSNSATSVCRNCQEPRTIQLVQTIHRLELIEHNLPPNLTTPAKTQRSRDLHLPKAAKLKPSLPLLTTLAPTKPPPPTKTQIF